MKRIILCLFCIIFTSYCSEQVNVDDFKKTLPSHIKSSSVKDCQENIEACTKLLVKNSKDVTIYCVRACYKFQLNDYKSAIEDYTKAIELDPKCIVAIGNKGCCKYILGDKNGACEDWKKADELDTVDNDPYGFISKYCK